jgi:hypothetical protein
MIEQTNKLIGETDLQTLGEIYTSIFYSCFANKNVSGFSQSVNAFQICKISGNYRYELRVIIMSDHDDGLPDRIQDSVKFYDLLNLVGGNRPMAKISPIIQFKILPEDFLRVDKWLSSLSKISIDINVYSGLCSDKETEETFSVEDLKIFESYQAENLSVAKTVSGSIIDVSSKTPVSFTVTLSDWIVEALSKDYLKLSVSDKLFYNRNLLPVIK